MNVDYLGRLIPRYKIRTKKKVIKAIVDKMIEHAENGTDYSGKCYISNSACYEDARAVADLVEKNFPKLDGKVLINSIGTTIGSHTGPGTVALFFWGDERKASGAMSAKTETKEQGACETLYFMQFHVVQSFAGA